MDNKSTFSVAKGNIPIVKKIVKNRNHENHSLIAFTHVRAVFQAVPDTFVQHGLQTNS